MVDVWAVMPLPLVFNPGIEVEVENLPLGGFGFWVCGWFGAISSLVAISLNPVVTILDNDLLKDLSFLVSLTILSSRDCLSVLEVTDTTVILFIDDLLFNTDFVNPSSTVELAYIFSTESGSNK